MKNAELKTIREGLGLTLQDVAGLTGVQQRTVQYWEAGTLSVPNRVGNMLEALEYRVEAVVLKEIFEINKPKKGGHVTLERYQTDEDLHRERPDLIDLTARTHAVILNRIRRRLKRLKITAIIKYFELT